MSELSLLKTVHFKSSLPDHVPLDQKEALTYQMTAVKKWPRPSEVFFLKYSPYVASGVTFLSCSLIHFYLQRAFKIDYKFIFASFGTGILAPCYLSSEVLKSAVIEKTVLMKKKCSVCIQLDYALRQFPLCVFSPAIVTAITCATYAAHKKSPALPVSQDFSVFFKSALKIAKATAIKLFPTVGLINGALIFCLPYMINMEFYKIASSQETESDWDSNSET